MDRLNYRGIVNQLAEIDQWLGQRGLTQNDRIRTHQHNIAELAQATDERRLDAFRSFLTEEKRREILWSLVESVEFVDAINALRRQGCPPPPEVLKRALEGPADLYLEDSKSNLGRNTMFEIVVAGRAAFAGLKPRLGSEPDVLFEFNGRRMLVQCKRVLSEGAVPKRIGEAAKQLKRDLNNSCSPTDCGLIAVSVSRLLNPGDSILTADCESDLRTALRREIDEIIKRNTRSLGQVKDPRVAAVLFQASTPAFVKELGLYTVASSATVYHIPGKSDAVLLQALAAKITI
ncbi:MAG: hypothetical protein WCB12_10975 [Bryobacteraceae bacterium]